MNTIDKFSMAVRVCTCLAAACLGEFILGIGSVAIHGGMGATVPVSALAVVGLGSLVSAWWVTGRK